jgi:peptide/nickel transport system substrate-binding protein
MSERRTITRRQFLTVSTLAAAGALAAACAPSTPAAVVDDPAQPVVEPVVEEKPQATAAAPAEPAAPTSKYKEAPELAALVAAGTLPPVDERLPLEPFVVGPGVRLAAADLDWEVGRYSEAGEVLRTVTQQADWSYPCQHSTYEWFLNTPPHNVGPITPGLCGSWSVNDDLTEYNLTLRKGVKWSDGVPVTTEDIRFGWHEWMLNPELVSTIGRNFKAGVRDGGEPMTVEIIDDFSVKITFGAPNARFLRNLGMGSLWGSYTWLMKPRHYMEQFHKDFADPDVLKANLDKEGLSADEWYRLALDKDFGGGGCPVRAIGFPVLTPYVVAERPDDLLILNRNPYYWRVDTEGQQLPYVGRTESVVVSSVDNIPAQIVNGDINWCREILNHTDIALYKENEARHPYKVYLDLVYHNAPVAMFFNLNNPDPVWREVVQKKEFRRGVNAAINFEEIIQVLFLGMGQVNPWLPETYNPARAAELFDAAGLDQKDADGWRLGPDGKRFEFTFDVRLDPLYVKPAEVIKTHLEEVGIYTPTKSMETTLWVAMRDANEMKAAIDWLDDCNWPFLVNDYMPEARIRWAQLWQQYMATNGAQGEEPPDWMLELYEIEAIMGAVNPNTDEGAAIKDRLFAWLQEHVPMVPLARDVVDPCIVPDNLGNLAKSGRSSAVWFSQEQVFFKK